MIRRGDAASLFWPWVAISAIWIGAVFYFESLDGLLFEELGEVLSTALLPPILLPIIPAGIVRIIADLHRP